jgi:hypothetical protein
MAFPLITPFLRQATEHGSRSTVLRPLGWVIAILAGSVVAAIEFKAPAWMGITLVSFMGLALLLYLGAFVYCLLTDKEALRSEKYSIEKLAIEKGIFGDSISGIIPTESDKMFPPAKPTIHIKGLGE